MNVSYSQSWKERSQSVCLTSDRQGEVVIRSANEQRNDQSKHFLLTAPNCTANGSKTGRRSLPTSVVVRLPLMGIHNVAFLAAKLAATPQGGRFKIISRSSYC